MPSQFALIRLHPCSTEEHINIGVIVFGESETRCHFVKNGNRVRSFYKSLTGKTLEETSSVYTWATTPPSFESFVRMRSNYQNTLQFSGMQLSTLGVEETMAEVVPMFLHEPYKKSLEERI